MLKPGRWSVGGSTFWICAVLAAWTLARSAAAQPSEPAPPLTAPYVSVSLRSIGRSKEILDYLFGTVLRSDIVESIRTAIIDEAFSLEGIDLTRPLGYLAVMRTPDEAERQQVELAALTEEIAEAQAVEQAADGEAETADSVPIQESPPAVEDAAFDIEQFFDESSIVFFGGVTDPRAARRLLDGGLTPTTRFQAAEGRDDLYVAIDSADKVTALTVRINNGDCYLGDGECRQRLDQLATLPHSPFEVAARHDAMLTLQARQLPLRLRRRFADTLWSNAAPGLQQRDDEAPEDFEYRNATSRSFIELLDLAVTGIEEATLAGDVIEAERRVRARFELAAIPDSELAKRLSDLDGPPSMFLPLHDPAAAFSFCVSIRLTEFEQELLSRWIRWFRACADGEGVEVDYRDSVRLACDCLQATIAAGRLDFLIQFEISGPDDLGVIGGLRLVQASQLHMGLAGYASAVARDLEAVPDEANDPTITSVATHDVALQRFQLKEEITTADGAKRTLDVCVGAGRGALWFAGGTFDSLDRIKAMFDRVEAAGRDPESPRVAPPLFLTISAGAWQKLPLADDHDSRLHRSLAEEAFAADDRARLELRPTRNGVRLEGSFEEGFLRWAALIIASEYDESQL